MGWFGTLLAAPQTTPPTNRGRAGGMDVASTNGRHPQDPDRDWMLRALRGDITSELAYSTIQNARLLRNQGRLDNESIAALSAGDYIHSDDIRRFDPPTEPWIPDGLDTDPATEAAFDQLVANEDYEPEWDLDTP